jgi:hypothetical protein
VRVSCSFKATSSIRVIALRPSLLGNAAAAQTGRVQRWHVREVKASRSHVAFCRTENFKHDQQSLELISVWQALGLTSRQLLEHRWSSAGSAPRSRQPACMLSQITRPSRADILQPWIAADTCKIPSASNMRAQASRASTPTRRPRRRQLASITGTACRAAPAEAFGADSLSSLARSCNAVNPACTIDRPTYHGFPSL